MSKNNSKNLINFSKSYIDYLSQVLNKINKKSISDLEKLLEKTRRHNNTIFIAGNGGAASTAITMANDLGFDVLKKTKIKKTFKIQSLNDNPSVITAIANDTGYENTFVNQLKIHFKKGDILIVLSASGNSLGALDE